VKRSVLIAGVVAALAALAGCGGSSPSPSQTTTAMTHKEFVATLDAICKRRHAGMGPLAWRLGKAYDANEYLKFGALLEQELRMGASYDAEVARLTAPPADAAAFARWKTLGHWIDGITVREAAAYKAKEHDEAERLDGRAYRMSGKRNEVALNLGVRHCVS